MRIDRRQFIIGGTSAVAALSLVRCGPAPTEAARWSWVGGVTSESARIRALVAQDSVLRLSTFPDLTGATEIAASAIAGGVHTFELSGLAPATRYYYAVDGEQISTLKTFANGPAPIKIAFGSCADTGSDHAVFSAIADRDPDLFIHLGDMHYENIGRNDVAQYQSAIKKVMGAPNQANLFSNVATAYVWDDHDFGPNNSDRTSPSRDAARRAYRELVPHYPLPSEGAIHQAFSIGCVRMVLLDLRSERQPEPKKGARTLLGSEQLGWFLKEIETASKTHALVVIGSSVPWIGEGGDTWGGFAGEREEIARFIHEKSIRNLMMISGDAHMAAFDDGSNNRYAGGESGFPVFFASSFDRPGSTKGGPYSGGTVAGRGHFGLLEVNDDGTSPVEITARAIDAQDRELLRFDLSLPNQPNDV